MARVEGTLCVLGQKPYSVERACGLRAWSFDFRIAHEAGKARLHEQLHANAHAFRRVLQSTHNLTAQETRTLSMLTNQTTPLVQRHNGPSSPTTCRRTASCCSTHTNPQQSRKKYPRMLSQNLTSIWSFAVRQIGLLNQYAHKRGGISRTDSQFDEPRFKLSEIVTTYPALMSPTLHMGPSAQHMLVSKPGTVS